MRGEIVRDKNLFITGGAGFIGTSLAKRLIDDNHIIVYDNLSRNALRDSGLRNHPNLDVIQGDVLDHKHLEASIPTDVDIIIHMAAIAGIDTVIKNTVKTMEVNMVGTYFILRTLQRLRIAGTVERFLMFSTSEVFGISAFRVNEATSTLLQPVGEARWTYAVGKLAAEHLAHSYHKEFGLRAVYLRPFNIYGPGQVGEGAVHHFVVRAIKNEPLEIHGEGDQIRSWCYIDDTVEAILLCLKEEKAVGQVFNIGNPKGTVTILSLAEKIRHLADSKSKVVHIPKKYVDVELRIPSIDKARELLGFEPKIDLDEGLRRTIEWYRRRQR